MLRNTGYKRILSCADILDNGKKRRRKTMEEKVYKTMKRSGALNIAAGILSIVAGLTGGILLIISGSKLLTRKSKVLF